MEVSLKKAKVFGVNRTFVFVCIQNGATPLFAAACNGHPETCRELIERGATIDMPYQVRTNTLEREVL